MSGMTVNSSSSPFCTPAQFVLMFDYRSFAQLASDTDVRFTESALLNSAVLAAKLQIASGKVEMAATRGARYDPINDLAAMAAGTTNGAWALAELVAGIAAFEMFGRRFEAMPDYMQAKVQEANAILQALENGEVIFPFTQTQQAGLLNDYKETEQDVNNRNLPSLVAQNLFGRRDNRLGWPSNN